MSRHFQQVFNEFGQRIGVSELALDEQGYCHLRFDEVDIHFQTLDDGERVLCHAPVGVLLQDTNAALVWELLNANYLYRQTLGATLGWDAQSGQCILSSLVDARALDVNGLEAITQHLVNAAEHWMQRLALATQTSSASQNAADFADTVDHQVLMGRLV